MHPPMSNHLPLTTHTQDTEPTTYAKPEDQLMMKITGEDPSKVVPMHVARVNVGVSE